MTLAINAVNLVLDPLLIFGLDWRHAGAAWATVIAQWLGALVFLWLLFVRQREKLGRRLQWPRLRELGPFLRIGWELVVRTFSLVLALAPAAAVAACPFDIGERGNRSGGLSGLERRPGAGRHRPLRRS